METILLFSQSQKNFWEFLPTVHEAIQQQLNDWVEVTQLKLLTPSACRERNFVSSSWSGHRTRPYDSAIGSDAGAATVAIGIVDLWSLIIVTDCVT